MQKESFSNPKHWWNKLAVIEEPELLLLPKGFLRKYKSYLNSIRRWNVDHAFEKNKEYRGYYDKIRGMEAPETTEESLAKVQALQDAYLPDEVTSESLIRQDGDYMKR